LVLHFLQKPFATRRVSETVRAAYSDITHSKKECIMNLQYSDNVRLIELAKTRALQRRAQLTAQYWSALVQALRCKLGLAVAHKTHGG
jgi:hypothetical protein